MGCNRTGWERHGLILASNVPGKAITPVQAFGGVLILIAVVIL